MDLMNSSEYSLYVFSFGAMHMGRYWRTIFLCSLSLVLSFLASPGFPYMICCSVLNSCNLKELAVFDFFKWGPHTAN